MSTRGLIINIFSQYKDLEIPVYNFQGSYSNYFRALLFIMTLFYFKWHVIILIKIPITLNLIILNNPYIRLGAQCAVNRLRFYCPWSLVKLTLVTSWALWTLPFIYCFIFEANRRACDWLRTVHPALEYFYVWSSWSDRN
jgi:hypothetical protein